MKTRITVTINEDVLKKARSYAVSTHRSLSELVGEYLENLVNDDRRPELNPRLRNIVGAVRLPKKFNEKKELSSYYQSKHS